MVAFNNTIIKRYIILVRYHPFIFPIPMYKIMMSIFLVFCCHTISCPLNFRKNILIVLLFYSIHKYNIRVRTLHMGLDSLALSPAPWGKGSIYGPKWIRALSKAHHIIGELFSNFKLITQSGRSIDPCVWLSNVCVCVCIFFWEDILCLPLIGNLFNLRNFDAVLPPWMNVAWLCVCFRVSISCRSFTKKVLPRKYPEDHDHNLGICCCCCCCGSVIH